jgi:alpha-beta hydrolase superfamily lysophospholipase
LAAPFLLASCLAAGPDRDRAAAGIAAAADLEPAVVHTAWFDLQAYRRRAAGDDALTVFIEGDGFAYIAPNHPSDDPTPLDPVALRLAAAETGASVLYLARPCQFAVGRADSRCDAGDWTTRRFSRPAVLATNAAIDQELAYHPARQLIVIGHSGGGVLAALVAAERRDVALLVTLAAPLDIEAWTRLRGLSPLSGSENPVDHAATLARIPQIHFAGERDANVPVAAIQSFIQRLGAAAPVRLIVMPDYDHRCCWARDAAELRRQAWAFPAIP